MVFFVAVMTFHGLGGEHKCKHSKNQRLTRPDDDLQPVENSREERRDQERHDEQHELAGKDISEKTEGQTDNLAELGYDLKQTDAEVDCAHRLFLEIAERVEIDEFLEVIH